MRQVIHGSKTYALVLSADDFQPGVRFVSESEWPLQVGLLMPPAGHTIEAHTHLSREVHGAHHPQEFFFVMSGRVEVDFYDEAGQCVHTVTVHQGEALLHIQGGHGFRFPEETQMIEVKSGPYPGRAKDKVFIDS